MKEEHVLVSIGRKRFASENRNTIDFVRDAEANAFLNNIEEYPHAFVLACCMDRQIKSEIAWMIPYRIKQLIGSFDMKVLASVTLDEYRALFADNSLHRYLEVMAGVFYDAVQQIHQNYKDDASEIWSDCPSSATVVYRFLQFNGVGIKIATMAANLLARQFKIPFSDYCSIDISPDIHVRRVMSRMGLVEHDANNEMIIYKARELCPDFPGIIDFSLWEIGRTWCYSQGPDCQNCIVCSCCLKNI